ncbi:MAG: beta-lactamase family protein [Chloroflexota bacterium]|nr:beta-lactamase family protein [Chloroflexota bacterium]
MSGSATARLDPQRLEPVFAQLEERVQAGHVPGAALAIGDADGAIRSQTFTSDAGRSIDRESLFFLASLTKPIFATAMMQLVEDGRLELHEAVARYLPEFAGPQKELVTAWHLLTHTSGVADILPEVIRRERPSARRMTQLALSAPLRFEPGTSWEYCSASYYVMAELMHRISGINYRRYVAERLFSPLGMETTFDPRRKGRPIVPVEGVGADNRLKRFLLLRYVVSIAAPGGGLFATLDDLLTFGAALLRPRGDEQRQVPLRRETIEMMARDQTRGLRGIVEGVERPVHFALGWNKPTLMYSVPGSERVIAHGGATGTSLWIDPAANLVFVYFTNQWNPDRSPQLEALEGVYRILGAQQASSGAGSPGHGIAPPR